MPEVTLQNNGESRFKDWYLDIKRDDGDVILWDQDVSGTHWELTNHGDRGVTLQNIADTDYRGCYLDIDGNTGEVILSESEENSGVYWRLTDEESRGITLRNNGDSRYRGYYLDIDSNISGREGNPILSGRGTGIYWTLNEH